MSDWKKRAALSSATELTTSCTASRNQTRQSGSGMLTSETSGSEVTAQAPASGPCSRIHGRESAQTMVRVGEAGGRSALGMAVVEGRAPVGFFEGGDEGRDGGVAGLAGDGLDALLGVAQELGGLA